MRTSEILDADGNVLHAQEMDDSAAPVLYAGQSARLLAIDGETLSKASRAAVGPDAPPLPDPADLETEASRESLRDSAEAAEKRAAAAKARSAGREKAAKPAADAAEPASKT